MTEEATETRQRVTYALQPVTKTLQISFGEEALVLKTADDLTDETVRNQLVLEGLRAYLQKATLRTNEEDKLVELEKAYRTLLTEGMSVFDKKGPGGHSGPRKADKIAALAALKGTTPDAIKAALKGKPTDKVDALLNSPKVLAAVEKLRAKAEQLDLDL
jgi:hypothetical protein